MPRLRLPARPSSGSGKRVAVTGLHVEPGEVVAVEAQSQPRLEVTRAGAVDLAPGLVRDGEVIDPEGLGAALKELFAEHGLGRRVRVGVANQRTVMRTIDLPPLRDEADIEGAIRLNAPEHIAMPLEQALMDYHVLGTVETPEGPRTRVVVAATDRESVERLLEALRIAGLRAAGADLSAFALIRALYRSGETAPDPILYAHVGGATTLAVAEGPICRFTRAAPLGLDALAGDLAEREGVSVLEARSRLFETGLEGLAADAVARDVLEAGVDRLGDDLRTSIEFFTSQWGLAVVEAVLTGPALGVPGLSTAVERRVGIPVRAAGVDGATDNVEPWRAAIAAGLAVEEVAA